MTNKFEFVKETSFEGKTFWYTQKNGNYISESLKHDRAEAYSLFEIIKERGDLQPTREVEESYEKV